mgnify:CR=1 FL=1
MKLVPGLYENVVTRAVDEAVRAAGAEVDSEREALNAEAAPYVLGRYLFDALVRALRNLPEEERLAQQVALTNRLIEVLGEAAPNAGIDADEKVLDPAELLLAVRRVADARLGPARWCDRRCRSGTATSW